MMVRASNGIAAALASLASTNSLGEILVLLSERYSYIDFRHNANGRATAVNPLLLFVTFNNSHKSIHQVPTAQDPNSAIVEKQKWQNNRLVPLPLFGCSCHY